MIAFGLLLLAFIYTGGFSRTLLHPINYLLGKGFYISRYIDSASKLRDALLNVRGLRPSGLSFSPPAVDVDSRSPSIPFFRRLKKNRQGTPFFSEEGRTRRNITSIKLSSLHPCICPDYTTTHSVVKPFFSLILWFF
jgi:hypothetical protein